MIIIKYIYIKNEKIVTIIYEQNFFNIINNSPEGNCLFNCISYYIYGNETNIKYSY